MDDPSLRIGLAILLFLAFAALAAYAIGHFASVLYSIAKLNRLKAKTQSRRRQLGEIHALAVGLVQQKQHYERLLKELKEMPGRRG